MKDVDAAWLAAAIDGEGTISLVKNRTTFSPFIGVFNMNEEFCKKAQSLVGSGGISCQKTCYRFSTTRADTVRVTLKEILPYLIVKKSNAELMMKWLDTKDRSIFSIFRGLSGGNIRVTKDKNGLEGNHHLKGNRGQSEQHRVAALSAVNHHLKGNRGNIEQHRSAGSKRRKKQVQIDKFNDVLVTTT